jgi:prepilin peptidase CpaA
MTALLVLLTLLLVAAVTDSARHQIYNWNTYPGMLAGLILNDFGLGVLGIGWDGLQASAVGFLACGLIMLVAFVFFDMGGGDVKLVAMMGAFLGVEAGIEALLWTFSIGFVFGVALIIWQIGIVNIVRKTWQHVGLVLKARGWIPLTTQERQPLQRSLFLAPSAFVATVIVVWPILLRS